jgi:hypothetical protein
MNIRIIVLRNIALMAVFVAVALTTFSANVRTVQIIGLLACGAVVGAALSAIVNALRLRALKS